MLLVLLHCAVKVLWHPNRGPVLGLTLPRVLSQGGCMPLLTWLVKLGLGL
jgi:hypothetical protein